MTSRLSRSRSGQHELKIFAVKTSAGTPKNFKKELIGKTDRICRGVHRTSDICTGIVLHLMHERTATQYIVVGEDSISSRISARELIRNLIHERTATQYIVVGRVACSRRLSAHEQAFKLQFIGVFVWTILVFCRAACPHAAAHQHNCIYLRIPIFDSQFVCRFTAA